jgi:hypothetical protein
MSDPEAWQAKYREVQQVMTRVRSLPLEQRSSEALIEIIGQLMELNQNMTELTTAVEAVADAP